MPGLHWGCANPVSGERDNRPPLRVRASLQNTIDDRPIDKVLSGVIDFAPTADLRKRVAVADPFAHSRLEHLPGPFHELVEGRLGVGFRQRLPPVIGLAFGNRPQVPSGAEKLNQAVGTWQVWRVPN